jgi:hypothetical protein
MTTHTATEAKKMIKGCNRIVWQSGADTEEVQTIRKANAVLNFSIKHDDADLLGVVIVGKSAYLIESSRLQYNLTH